MRHFRLLGRVDVQPVVNLLPALDSVWARQTLRQSAPGSPHRDTECIYLRMPPVVDAETIFSSLEVIDWEPYPCFPALGTLVGLTAFMAAQPVARVMLVKLKAGGVIAPHIDQGAYAEQTDRYHVAIVTDPRVVMLIGDELLFCDTGSVVWFDKHALHSVRNDSGLDRVHLIVDCWRSLDSE